MDKLITSRWDKLIPGIDKIGIKCKPLNKELKFFQSKNLNSNKNFIIQINLVEDFDINDIPKFELLKISYYIRFDKINIICELVDDEYSDVFDYQIDHIVKSLCILKEPEEIILKAKALIHIWANYLLVEHRNGISENNQRGLFGELWFLKNKIIELTGLEKGIDGYLGRMGRQDFHFNQNLFELKTSISNNPKKIHISNEKQLDVPENLKLNLVFISMDKYKNNKQTLHDLIMELRTLFIVNSNLEYVTKFDNFLLEYGYPLHDSEKYDEYGYQVRNLYFFKVEEDFPRITDKDLKDGVASVNYSIELSACFPYEIEENEALKELL